MITVEITNDQSHFSPDERRLEDAVRAILEEETTARVRISLAVVDDATISQLHKKYLQQDEPTDVLSFVLERSEDCLEGEVIVSAETAALTAGWYGLAAEDELLLYVIHGTLHLVGYDDTTREKEAKMREREQVYLAHFGVEQRCANSDVVPKKSATGGKRLR